MARPNRDRIRVEVYLTRSSVGWLDSEAAKRGLSRGAFVRALFEAAVLAGIVEYL